MAAPGRRAALTLAVGGTMLVIADSAVLTLALSEIGRELPATPGELQLAVVVYQATFAATVVLGGRLADVVDRRTVLTYGLVAFAVASAAGAAAGSASMLIAARAAQGLAAAAVFPQASAAARLLFEGEDQAKAVGGVGSAIAAAGIAGPSLGGLLLVLDPLGWGWRTIFAVNVPICLALAGRLALRRPALGDPGRGRLDVAGALWVTAGLLLVIPAVLAPGGGLPSGLRTWSVPLAAAGLAILIAWSRTAGRRKRAGLPVLIDPGLFRDGAFRAGAVTYLLAFGAASGYAVVLPFHLQTGIGFSPLAAALVTVMSPAGGVLAGALVARLGQLRRGMGPYAGALLAAAAVVLISLLAGVGDPRPSPTLAVALAAAVFAGGFGFGLLSPALFRTTISRSPRTDTGAVTGLLTTVQQFARVLGVLTIGSVFFSAVSRGDAAGSLGLWFATAMALSAVGFLLAAAVMRRLVVTAGSVP